MGIFAGRASSGASRRVAVVGAGPAGCAAAHALARGGRRVVVFEASDAVGGRTRTWRAGELQVDSGAGFFTNFYPTLWGYLRALDLRKDVQSLSRSNYLVREGKRAELTLGSVRSFVTFPFLDARAKAKMAAQTLGVALRYRGLDLRDPRSMARFDDRSIAEDARRRVGEDAYQVIVRCGIEPFWYFSCEEVSRSLSLALHARAATARFYTLRGGMDSVCRALVEDLDVRVSAPIAELSRRGTGFVVKGPGGEEAFDEVVLATTASVAHRLLGPLTEELPPSLVGFLGTQRYVPSVHAVFRVPKGQCPKGASALFACDAGPRRIAAISFNGGKNQYPNPAAGAEELVSVFPSARESLALLDRPKAEWFEACWSLARDFCPELPATAVPWEAIARREAIPIHGVGRYRRAAEALDEQKPPLVFAGDYWATATVDGALHSGWRAARRLMGDR